MSKVERDAFIMGAQWTLDDDREAVRKIMEAEALRRYPDAPPSAPAEKRWRCKGCGRELPYGTMLSDKYEYPCHIYEDGSYCGPVVESCEGGVGEWNGPR